jgi:hypothetical protein
LAQYKTISQPDIIIIYSHILTLEKAGTTVNYHGIFITSTPRANVLRVFICNLQMGQIRWSICPWQASLAYSNFCEKAQSLPEWRYSPSNVDWYKTL